MKEIWVKFSEEADTEYKSLQQEALKETAQGTTNSFNAQLLKAIERTKINLKLDPQFGTHIPRNVITKQVIER